MALQLRPLLLSFSYVCLGPCIYISNLIGVSLVHYMFETMHMILYHLSSKI